jgi:hypothetical protein
MRRVIVLRSQTALVSPCHLSLARIPHLSLFFIGNMSELNQRKPSLNGVDRQHLEQKAYELKQYANTQGHFSFVRYVRAMHPKIPSCGLTESMGRGQKLPLGRPGYYHERSVRLTLCVLLGAVPPHWR